MDASDEADNVDDDMAVVRRTFFRFCFPRNDRSFDFRCIVFFNRFQFEDISNYFYVDMAKFRLILRYAERRKTYVQKCEFVVVDLFHGTVEEIIVSDDG